MNDDDNGLDPQSVDWMFDAIEAACLAFAFLVVIVGLYAVGLL